MSFCDANFDGWLSIHSVPANQIPRVVAKLAAILVHLPVLDWSLLAQAEPHTAARGLSPVNAQASVHVSLHIDQRAFEAIAATLAECENIFFEIAHPLSANALGERICYAPTLGIYRSSLDQFGNQVINENRLLKILSELGESNSIEKNLREALGLDWDEKFEQLRGTSANALERKSLAS
jgi:hypothetical protein